MTVVRRLRSGRQQTTKILDLPESELKQPLFSGGSGEVTTRVYRGSSKNKRISPDEFEVFRE